MSSYGRAGVWPQQQMGRVPRDQQAAACMDGSVKSEREDMDEIQLSLLVQKHNKYKHYWT